jgi:hypothetical protein
MTRAKWTTKDQEAWLEERKPAFLAANQKKCAAKEYFPLITKEFRKKWPVPSATQNEIEAAGSLESATRGKINKYDRVSSLCNKEWGETHISIAYLCLVS